MAAATAKVTVLPTTTKRTRGPRKEKPQLFVIDRSVPNVTTLKLGGMAIPGLTDEQVMGILMNAINSGALIMVKTINPVAS